MQIKITNLYTNKVQEFEGEGPSVAHDIYVAFPWLHEYDLRTTDVVEVLAELEQNQALIIEVEDDKIQKSEGKTNTAKEQLGYDIHRERLMDAARWLSGFKEARPEAEIRNLMLEQDGDLEAVALLTYRMEPTEKNKIALRAVQDMEGLSKAEQEAPTPPHSIIPGTDTAYNVCQAVQRAFQDHHVEYIQLGGKHSKGSMLAKDGGSSYILKSGSGGQSPAAGISDEIASQARREAAFYHVAKAWGMGEFFPAAEFLIMDGHDWATLELLAPSFKNLEKVREEHPQHVHQALEQYRLRGILHRWAAVDYILGNADRHAANLMIEPNGKIRLIDHGSSFAGANFSPGHDSDSFIPFYLRYLAGDSFYEMDPEQKLDAMPHMNEAHDRVLAQWIRDLDEGTLSHILTKFGLDPGPSLERLKEFKELDPEDSVSSQTNQMWLG